jgi:CheY-like chemotaxis protein
LILVLANTAQSWHLQSQPMITRHALRAQRTQTQNRILLAEDNPVNQKVASKLLEKLQYRVDVVADGLAAVAAWQTGKFDLIVMDCQMPQMDGYEATREIRRFEAGGRHIPIVALTAHAMTGDEAKCRAAGMDDYLSKPIDRSKLEACLERLLIGSGSTLTVATRAVAIVKEEPVVTAESPTATRDPVPVAASAPPSAPVTPHTPVDWDALLESIDGDKGFARDLADAFVATGTRELAAISTALDTGDAAGLRMAAHTLKGASANLRAPAVAAAAAQLESAAGQAESAQTAALAEKLTAEVTKMTAYLQSKVG